jgi:hypothetical protein
MAPPEASHRPTAPAAQSHARENRLKPVPPHLWIVLVILAVFWFALGSRIVPQAKQHDFLNLYSGGTLAARGSLRQIYQPEVQLATERGLVPGLPELVPFVRPPFYALALGAFAEIPYSRAFAVWLGLQIAVYVALLAWAKSRWGPQALLFGAMFLPAALGIASGQDCVFMLAIIVGVIALEGRGREAAAGAVLALGLIKFHLFVAWPVILLVQKRWRMLAGAAAVTAGEILLSWLLVGSSGLADYVSLLGNQGIARLSPSRELMINVQALTLNLGEDNAYLRLLLVLSVMSLAVMVSLRAPFRSAVVAATTASILVSPHVYGYDAALLLPSFCLVLFETRATLPRLLAVFLCSPIPYLLNLAAFPWRLATSLGLILFLLLLAGSRDTGFRLPWRRARSA